MLTNTTSLPVDLAGEILRNQYLANSKGYVSCPRPLEALPKWAANRCLDLLFSDYKLSYAVIGPDLVVIQQNDGDILLILWDIEDKVLYWNSDAKKAYGWKRECLD